MKTRPLVATLFHTGTLAASMATSLAASLATSTVAMARDRPVESLALADEWLNSSPLTSAELRGKVVLVDFWTYTCVNWIRTLPYVRAWAQKYKEQGLVVVGVHSPEFEFEKDVPHIRNAIEALRVDFPVAVDSEHAIWNAYGNQYWPAVYIVDTKGRIRHRQFGEGDYASIEKAIQELLAESGRTNVPGGLVSVETKGAEVAADWDTLRSPENYLGSARTQNFSSPEKPRNARPGNYTLPAHLTLNHWALAGNWTVSGDAVRLQQANGRIAYRFQARDVNLVMGSGTPGHPVKFRVLIDGKPPEQAHGTDVDARGFGESSEPRLYQLIRQHGPIVERLFEIEFLEPGAQAFSFTFG